jgi:hypothetical protein
MLAHAAAKPCWIPSAGAVPAAPPAAAAGAAVAAAAAVYVDCRAASGLSSLINPTWYVDVLVCVHTQRD